MSRLIRVRTPQDPGEREKRIKEWIDRLRRHLPPDVAETYMALRKLRPHNRMYTEITLRQLARAAGMDVPRCRDALDDLIDRDFVRIVEGPDSYVQSGAAWILWTAKDTAVLKFETPWSVQEWPEPDEEPRLIACWMPF